MQYSNNSATPLVCNTPAVQTAGANWLTVFCMQSLESPSHIASLASYIQVHGTQSTLIGQGLGMPSGAVARPDGYLGLTIIAKVATSCPV